MLLADLVFFFLSLSNKSINLFYVGFSKTQMVEERETRRGIILLFFLNKFIYFIYLFLAALGLRCLVWAFSSCRERGLLFVAVRGLLVLVASLVAEHRL